MNERARHALTAGQHLAKLAVDQRLRALAVTFKELGENSHGPTVLVEAAGLQVIAELLELTAAEVEDMARQLRSNPLNGP